MKIRFQNVFKKLHDLIINLKKSSAKIIVLAGLKRCRRGVLFFTIGFVFLYPALSFANTNIEQKQIPLTQDQVTREKIIELENQLKTQSAQLNALKVEMNLNLKKQESHAQALDKSSENQNKEIENLKELNTYNSKLSSEGAIILLVGLLIEILGALLLGAPVLATKIEELSDFEIDPGLDLAMHAPKKEAVLIFFSMIGNVLLFLGFTAQFVGTALVLSVDWSMQLTIVLFGLAVGFSMVLWLLGIDPEQSRTQKIAVVWKNIQRIFRLKINGLMLRGRECESCLKKVDKDQSYVFWYDEGNTTSHPYLHSPSKFLVGHEECINKEVTQNIEAQKNLQQRDKIKPHLHTMKGSDFISKRLDEYKNWFIGHYDHWLKIREDWHKPSKYEIAMDAAVAKIRKINS